MPQEFFGVNEMPVSEEYWAEAIPKMLNWPFLNYRNLVNLAQAEHQTKRFENMATLSGVVMFLLFLKFPVIRIQPGLKRIGISAGLAYPCYSCLNTIAMKLKAKRVKSVYTNLLVTNKGHPRLSI